MSARILKAFVFCAFASTSGTAHAAAPEVDPANDFKGLGFEVTSGGSIGSVVVFAAPRDIGGKLAICGTVFFEDATHTLMSVERQYTSRMSFRLAGKNVPVNTGVFSRYETEAEASAGKARCYVTRKPWQAGYASAPFEMRLAPGGASQ